MTTIFYESPRRVIKTLTAIVDIFGPEQEIVIGDYTAPSIDIIANDNVVECNGTGNTSELNTWLANNGGAEASDACSAITWTNDFTILNNDITKFLINNLLLETSFFNFSLSPNKKNKF